MPMLPDCLAAAQPRMASVNAAMQQATVQMGRRALIKNGAGHEAAGEALHSGLIHASNAQNGDEVLAEGQSAIRQFLYPLQRSA